MDLAPLLVRFDQGERRAVARALSIVEDGDPTSLRALVAALHGRTGRAEIIGITGPPGVGKSTLTNAVTEELRRRGRSVAILAVDPSSPFTGGALLGDRVRMQGHHEDAGVFIRSMAARGHLGGLSVATPLAVGVLDAAGFDVVLIETVGVGQSEVEVASMADSTIVAMAPGMGDGIQAAKAGILEIADLYVVNKADQPGAGKLVSELTGMLEFAHAAGSDGAWWPPILRTVAVRGEAIPELVDALEQHRAAMVASGELQGRRNRRSSHQVREIAVSVVRARFQLAGEDDEQVSNLGAEVAAGTLDPYAAADRLLEAVEGV